MNTPTKFKTFANYIAILIICLVYISCAGEGKKKEVLVDTTKVDTTSIVAKTDGVILPSGGIDRNKVILEIARFKQAINSKNKAEIMSFFNFPLEGSSVNFFEVDSLFDQKRTLNNGAITKEMFSGSFNRIYEMTGMVEFKDLFAAMNLELLKSQDNIKKEKRPKDDGCYYIYMISIKNDLVYFQYGTNSNDDYRKSHPDEEEICGEYAQMWTFKFDGKKLKFLTHRIAG